MCISVPGEVPDHNQADAYLDRLSERLAGIHGAASRASGVRNAADAELVALIAEVDGLGSWAAEGACSMEHWIAWQLGVNRQRARSYLLTARRRTELPHAHSLFDAGRLSIDQMLLITRHCPPEFDHDVAEFAQYATISQLSRSLRKYVFDGPTEHDHSKHDHSKHDDSKDADPDAPGSGKGPGSPTKHPDEVGGVAECWVDEEGFTLRLRGSQADGLWVRTAIDQARTWLDGTRTDGIHTTTYDALLFLLEQGLTTDPSPHRPARTRVLIHLDVDQWDRWTNYQHLGGALDPEVMKLLTCDAETQTVLTKSGRSPHLGRRYRIVPDWLRTLILDRDGCCRVPGCGRTLGLDVHHLRHWSDGGETTPSNLVTLCRRHHTLHHQGGIGIEGDPEHVFSPGVPDGLVFTNHHGRPIHHPPPDPAPPPREHRAPPVYRHPTGERLRWWAVHFNRNSPHEPPGKADRDES